MVHLLPYYQLNHRHRKWGTKVPPLLKKSYLAPSEFDYLLCKYRHFTSSQCVLTHIACSCQLHLVQDKYCIAGNIGMELNFVVGEIYHVSPNFILALKLYSNYYTCLMQNDLECNLKWAKLKIFLGEYVFRVPAFVKYQILKFHVSTEDPFSPPLYWVPSDVLEFDIFSTKHRNTRS